MNIPKKNFPRIYFHRLNKLPLHYTPWAEMFAFQVTTSFNGKLNQGNKFLMGVQADLFSKLIEITRKGKLCGISIVCSLKSENAIDKKFLELFFRRGSWKIPY